MEEQIRYNWLRDEKNNPVACIATKQHPEFSGMLLFALAIYNKKDKFSKQFAKELLVKRLDYHSHAKYRGTVSKQGNIKLFMLQAIAGNASGFGSPDCGSPIPKPVRQAAAYRLLIYKPRPKVNA